MVFAPRKAAIFFCLRLVLRKDLVAALTDLAITDDTHLPSGFADGGAEPQESRPVLIN